MRWTRVQTRWFGTTLEKHGRWHGIPFVLRGVSATGMTPLGWVTLGVAAVMVLALVVVTELIP